MSASDDHDDYILQETLDGKSARAIGKQLKCTVGEVHTVLDRVLPTIDNEARLRHIMLDLQRLEQLLAVFLKRAIEDKDQPSGMLCVKILERKAALIGIDSPTRIDVLSLQVPLKEQGHDRVRLAIERIARRAGRPPDGDGVQ